MNSKQAKQIELEKVLNHFGLKAHSSHGYYKMYYSPLHPDSKPSFAVYEKTNLWRDFGTGVTGTVIDLVMGIKQCDFQSALDYINLHFSNEKIVNINPISTPNFKASEEKNYTINDIKPLENKALLYYLKQRSINPQIAQKYCEEIYWENANGKKLFAISFKNDSNGYDVRNNFYKGNLLSKDITFIDKKQKDVKIFEGFIDFLSHLSENNIDDNTHNYIILNSVTMVNKLTKGNKLHDILNNHNKIECYLDNDNAGKECFKKIVIQFPHAIDKSDTYRNYNDYNEYVANKLKL